MKKVISLVGGASQIGRRGHDHEDFCHTDWSKMQIFNFDKAPQGKGSKERMKAYSNSVNRVFEEFYPAGTKAPESILHVTCTGYESPSGAQKIVEKRGWNQTTEVTHAYHMGCAAAFPSLRIAQGFLSATGKSTDVVHTELCSLHLNPAQNESEQLVVQTLFADGFIRYTVVPKDNQKPGLEILTLHEEIVPNSSEAMSWTMSEWGMDMVLSREVPNIIGAHLEGFLERMFQKIGLNFSRVRDEAVFAIHPGGPKIIDQIQKLVGFSEQQVKWSRDTLAEFGNMSSATLPHVWKSIVDKSEVAQGRMIVSLAFGPGLTICGGIFRKV